jgi:hypothetical protein
MTTRGLTTGSTTERLARLVVGGTLAIALGWPAPALAKKPCRSAAHDPGCNPPSALGNRTPRPLPAGSRARSAP